MRDFFFAAIASLLMTGAASAAEWRFLGPNGESSDGYSLTESSACTHRLSGQIEKGDTALIQADIEQTTKFYVTGGLQLALVPRIPPDAGTPMARDLSRDETKLLQSALAQNGFYSGAIDGVAGSGTQDGLRRFIGYRERNLDLMAPLEALVIVLVTSRQKVPDYILTELGIARSLFETYAQDLDFFVCLDSPGGVLTEGVNLAALFKDQHIPTKIEADAVCESACALAFMGGTQGYSESGVAVMRVLHPLGRLGFHSPALDIAAGQYSQDNVEKAFQLALEAIAMINEQLTSQSEGTEPYLKPSLLSALLRTPASTMLYVDTVDRAGQWSIDVGPIRDLPAVSDKTLTRSCIQSVQWAQDRSAFDTVYSYDNPLYISKKPDGRTAVLYGEMQELECLYRITPQNGLPKYEAELPRHVTGRFSALSYFSADTPLRHLARR